MNPTLLKESGDKGKTQATLSKAKLGAEKSKKVLEKAAYAQYNARNRTRRIVIQGMAIVVPGVKTGATGSAPASHNNDNNNNNFEEEEDE